MKYAFDVVSRILVGTTVILTGAAVISSITINNALASPILIRVKCTGNTCGRCNAQSNGDCVNANGDVKGACGSTGTDCAGCNCDYVSTLLPCVCSK